VYNMVLKFCEKCDRITDHLVHKHGILEVWECLECGRDTVLWYEKDTSSV